MNSSLSSITLNDGGDLLAGLISRERTDSIVSMGDRDVTFPMLQNQNELTMAPLQRLEELENENRRLREQLSSLAQQQSAIKPAPAPAPVQVQEIAAQSSISAPQLGNHSRGPLEEILDRFVEEVQQIMASTGTSNPSPAYGDTCTHFSIDRPSQDDSERDARQ
jgi:hypothetical protein